MDRAGRGSALARLLFAVALLLLLLSCDGTPPESHASQPPSIVLIVVDTLRADRLGSHGYSRPTSPELDRLARDAVVFERAIASSSWTLPSFASIYTGRHPGAHGAGEKLEGDRFNVTGIDTELSTLAEHLQGAGYATFALANNPFLHKKFGVARGFDGYSFVPANNRDIRNAATTVDQALEWIDSHSERPVFLMVHLFDPHMDYDPPEGIRGTFTADYQGQMEFPVSGGAQIRQGRVQLDAEDQRYVAGSYDEELLYTDQEIGRLFEGLATRGLLARSFVALTSDHGEELFDHGSFEHGHSGYQELLHVPLLLWGPELAPARIEAPVSHVDLLPTLLEAAGIVPPANLPGVSLIGVARGASLDARRAIIADRTLHGRRHRVLIRWPWKLIDVEGRSEAMLFDLERDPLEQRNLAEREPERLAAMIAEFEQLSPTRGRAADERRAAELDDGLRAQLEALGYAEPADAEGPESP